jgi:hypothetical protein
VDNVIFGIVILISGIFVATYGNVLFRIALAFIGFALGFTLAMWLGSGLDDVLRVVVGLVAGGIVAAIFFMLVKFALYIAGALLGLVLMLGLVGLFELSDLSLGIIGSLLVAAAAVVGGIFGPRLGNLVLVLATSFGGAYLVVIALSALFQDTVGPEVGDPAQPLALLGTSFPLVLFATITAISFLGQQQTSDLRRRLLR